MVALLMALLTTTHGLDLAGHLRALGAPRAAQRLDGGAPPVAPTPFAVDASRVRLVADAATAAAFSADVGAASEMALDCEWRPDGPGEDHAVALAQIAIQSNVWLVDFIRLGGPARTTALAALTNALQSQNTLIVAFSISADVSKLACALPCFAKATRVVDLATSPDGLSSVVRRWLPCYLDKAQQKSDWARRPLTEAQVAYAAADAAVLLPLLDAMRAGGAAPAERDLVPTPRTAGRVEAVTTDDDDDALATARAVVARITGCRVVAADAIPTDAVEVNALAVAAGDKMLLVVAEADRRIDFRWLSLALDTPRRRIRLSSRCVEAFGVAPHRVPPVPLRDAAVVATPSLLASKRPLWGSAGGDGYRVVFEDGAALARVAAPLPDPALYFSTLDDALDAYYGGSGAPTTSSGAVRLATGNTGRRVTLDASLVACARRLRMIGVDAAVAGEVLRREATPRRPIEGCDRVHVVAARVEADLRRAALEGRLVVVASSRKRLPSRGGAACYAVRAKTPDAQFDELLDVLGERGAVATWGSRCGICNGCDWRTLSPDDVRGEAPPGVLAEAPEYYRCGVCEQLFWPGAKYEDTMATLRGLALTESISA